jgi:hypothetical protein
MGSPHKKKRTPEPLPRPQEFVTAPAALRLAQRHFPITRATFYRWLDSGLLPSITIAGRYFIHREDLHRHLSGLPPYNPPHAHAS